MKKRRMRNRRWWLIVLLVIGVAATAVLHTDEEDDDSFLDLDPDYAQQLFGSTSSLNFNLGGVVVLQNGDVIAAECSTKNTKLHRFKASETYVVNDTVLHVEEITSTKGGCGITLHPDGYIYSNMNDRAPSPGLVGVAKIDPATGKDVDVFGPPGNALGIAVDPRPPHPLVYLDQGCKPSFVFPAPATCRIIQVDPATKTARTLASLSRAQFAYLDGIAFDPTGEFIFLTLRLPAFELVVLRRDGTVANRVPLPSEPIGIAFHLSPNFVVTTNTDGTITRLDFPLDDYTMSPAVSEFARDGFRSDLAQVGPDTCLYVTQNGTRYDDGETDPSGANSIVQICEGFATPPGITPDPVASLSSLCGVVYHDTQNDGAFNGADAGIAGVGLRLTGTDRLGRAVERQTTTGATGAYCFEDLEAGTYTISEMQPFDYLDGKDSQGTPGTGSMGNDVFSNVVLEAGVEGTNNNFGELIESSLCGFVYVDANNTGTRESGETGIGGVRVTLTGTDDRGTPVSMPGTTGTDGGYCFTGLRPGNYTLREEAQPAGYVDGKDTQGTPGTGITGNDVFSNIVLNQDVSGRDNNFGEIAVSFPAGGQFVIGDLADHAPGAIVNFWGAQWTRNNPMRGGRGPGAFKGWDSDAATPTCGDTWTSRPGNSKPPGTVPKRMAVIVSSQITKNGALIEGNVDKIILVETLPGYSRSPGHGGHGVVVGVLCGG